MTGGRPVMRQKIVVVDEACVRLSLPNEGEDGFGRNSARTFVTGRCGREKGLRQTEGDSVFE